MQAVLALTSQISRSIQGRKFANLKLEQFKAQADRVLKNSDLESTRNSLAWSGKRKFRVIERHIENKQANICSFILSPHDGGLLPAFKPGQFLTFELAVPDQSAPVVRCYSLSSSPEQNDQYRVSIKRLDSPPDSGADIPAGCSSCYFHNDLQDGDVLSVMTPNGDFHLNTDSERPVVLIGGGIGVTPVLSMLKWLSDTNSSREVWFFYAAINRTEIALVDEIRDIIASNPHFHCVVLYSDPTEKCIEGKDYDCTGYVSVELLKKYIKNSNYEFYLCGPPPMMASLTPQLLEWGVPEEDIHSEAFGPASVKSIGEPQSDEIESDEQYVIEFAKSNKSLTWTPGAGTLLEFAEENGIQINFGCRSGNCNTCITAIKSGDVTYLRKPVNKLEKGSTLVCIAKPNGDVSLDA